MMDKLKKPKSIRMLNFIEEKGIKLSQTHLEKINKI